MRLNSWWCYSGRAPQRKPGLLENLKRRMKILKDLLELQKENVISQETATSIIKYYESQKGNTTNRLILVFGILGAILIGLGLILILAHNWDELPRLLKTSLAFIPLIISQGLCLYGLLKKQDNAVWVESSSTLLFFTIGASIALVAQIYNIPGNTASFLFTWMILSLPVIYLLRSSITAILFVSGITYYACHTGYWNYPSEGKIEYWALFAMVLPHYYLLYKNKPKSNFMTILNWLIPISVIITLGTIGRSSEYILAIAYFSLFGLLYLIGDSEFFSSQSARINGYKSLGATGMISLLLIYSFDEFWEHLRRRDLIFSEIVATPEFVASIIISILALVLFIIQIKKESVKNIKPLSPLFLIFIMVFILGLFSNLSVVIINLIVFSLGILTIKEGAKLDNLRILNHGLLLITILVVCRFFDTDLSFILRGALFVFVGIGFFATNYWMLKKRKSNG
ncbi:MAG: hypothetical protein COB85_01300 [Bacteroidetes bacterium]|nr:MAG: hypothetical protein COB85_01300 [Bacteroidota bacterium]